MNMNEFTPLALRTESVKESLTINKDSLIAAMAVFYSASELLDAVKKSVFYGKPVDEEALNNHAGIVVRAASVIGFASVNGVFCQPDVALPLGRDFMRTLHGVIGMATESGELVKPFLEAMTKEDMMDAIKNLDLVNIGEELGDSDWYKAIIHDATGVSEDHVRAKVIAKLEKRYKDKQFNAQQAIERDLDGERAVLEA